MSSNLTPDGEKVIAALAERYAMGAEAVKMMLDAVARGGGSMAQFNLPEFGGQGQWMRGGLTMVGDMFNNSMRATVDSLCGELSNLLATQASLFAPLAPPASPGSVDAVKSWSSAPGAWWPLELGYPAATGAQNNARYAYFPNIRRLAIEHNARVEVYDTTGYDIRGFAQQQQGGEGGSLTFNSQRGVVRIDSFPRASYDKAAPEPRASQSSSSSPSQSQQQQQASNGDASSIVGLIEQLAQLKEKGVLTEAEFAAKKAELLKRL
jgi:hypothetical protein